MVTMQRGFKSKLDAGGIDIGQPLQVCTSITGDSKYEFSCIPVDENERVVDDRYVVFFNQPSSPNGEISVDDSSGNATFQVNIGSLPPQIYKLCFAVTIEGDGTMRHMGVCTVKLMQKWETAFSLDINGNQFKNQKAIITIQIYTKDKDKKDWRVCAVADGFNFPGGFGDLLAHYGAKKKPSDAAPAESSPQQNPPQPQVAQRPLQPQVAKNTGTDSNTNIEGFARKDDDWV